MGDLVLMAGYVILTDSRLAGIVAVAGGIWFVLAPVAEESSLEKQYGEAYRRYKEGHPRFLAWSWIRRSSFENA